MAKRNKYDVDEELEKGFDFSKLKRSAKYLKPYAKLMLLALFLSMLGSLLGLDGAFGAAIGFITLFCSVVNCPLTSIILAVEVFGGESILIFALVACVSYMTSGYTGLYHSQRIVYSKFSEKYINIHTK